MTSISKVRRGLMLLSLLALTACLGAGFKNYRRGNKLRKEGQLVQARAAYKQALATDPGSDKYQQAIEALESEIDERVADIVLEAKGFRREGRFAEAAARYEKAVRLEPGDQDLKAHAALCKLKSTNPDKDQWYAGLSEISRTLTGNRLVLRTLDGARASAYQFHLDQAEGLLLTGQGKKAFDEFEKARQIEPTLPGLDRRKLAHAEALHLAEQADLRLSAGEPVPAYELYRKALAKKDLPVIRAAMARAKRQASRLLRVLEQARKQAEAGRYQRALGQYQRLESMQGVPESVATEAAAVRDRFLASLAEEAQRSAERNSLQRARRKVETAVRFGDFPAEVATALKTAAKVATGREPGDAIKALSLTDLPESHPLVKAIWAMALKGAQNVLRNAQNVARRNSTKALRMISSLTPFTKKLPEIKQLRRKLLRQSFTVMLDEALRQAKRGNDQEAAEVLQAALSASKAPASMRDPAEQAARALSEERYIDAEQGFSTALTAAPRSKLAQRGLDIARMRRQAKEREALAIVRRDGAKIGEAVALLEASRRVEPQNSVVKQACDILLGRVGRGVDDARLSTILGYAARLHDMPDAVRASVVQGISRLAASELGAAETAFKDALASAPTNRIAKVGREEARGRLLGSLESGAAQVSTGDEDAARSLGRLLETDPNNADAKAALDALLVKADSAAQAGDDVTAGRFLGLVVIATNPAPGLRSALDKGIAALAGGQSAEAERLFTDAVDLEGGHPAAKKGLEIARRNRLSVLAKALDAAKAGQDYKLVQSALRNALELDPASKEARDAFNQLLAAARERGAAGEDRAVASLLDSANVVSRPESARSAISAANQLLGASKHEEARAAYTAVLKKGRSQLAITGKEIARDRIRQVLVNKGNTLEQGTDLESGAKAVAELLDKDATNEAARAAVAATITRAETAAAADDIAGAARELKAASVATRAGAQVDAAIELFASKDFEGAEKAFGALSGELARRAAEIAKTRKLARLQAGMAGEDETAAKSIRKMLQEDPTNEQARAALARLLKKAKTSGASGDHVAAAAALSAAVVASGTPEDLAQTIQVGTTHLGEARFAEAESAFTTALELAKDSEVVKTGYEVSSQRRLKTQRQALRALNNGDPTPHAKILQSSLLVDPDSRDVKRGLDTLLRRVRGAASSGDDAELARLLSAAVLLEGLSAERVSAVTEASALLAQGKHAEAKKGMTEVNADAEATPSKVAEAGAKVAHDRQVAVLRAELKAAENEKDVVKASGAVARLLEVAPNDAAAKTASRKYGRAVIDRYLEAAKAQKELGRLGAAHLYVRRILALDDKHSAALAEKATIEKELEKRLDFVIIVEKLARASSLASGACRGVGDEARGALMDQGAKHESLGGYILPREWTQAVEEKADDAPRVTGGLQVTLDACATTKATGDATIQWKLTAPRGHKVVVEGQATAKVSKGAIPLDEQDAAGKAARGALGKAIAKAVYEKLELERGSVDNWLMSEAEHWTAQKDSAQAADAFARLLVKAPRSFDPARAKAVEAFLDSAFE